VGGKRSVVADDGEDGAHAAHTAAVRACIDPCPLARHTSFHVALGCETNIVLGELAVIEVTPTARAQFPFGLYSERMTPHFERRLRYSHRQALPPFVRRAVSLIQLDTLLWDPVFDWRIRFTGERMRMRMRLLYPELLTLDTFHFHSTSNSWVFLSGAKVEAWHRCEAVRNRPPRSS